MFELLVISPGARAAGTVHGLDGHESSWPERGLDKIFTSGVPVEAAVLSWCPGAAQPSRLLRAVAHRVAQGGGVLDAVIAHWGEREEGEEIAVGLPADVLERYERGGLELEPRGQDHLRRGLPLRIAIVKRIGPSDLSPRDELMGLIRESLRERASTRGLALIADATLKAGVQLPGPLLDATRSRLLDALAHDTAMDADTNAVVLSVLARVNTLSELPAFTAPSLDSDPRTVGIAYALEALLWLGPNDPELLAAKIALAAHLAERQNSAGYWLDEPSDASWYHATTRSLWALALAGPYAGFEVALEWLLSTQHDDGSWGRLDGTRSETADVVLALARLGGHGDDVRLAVDKGGMFLDEHRQCEVDRCCRMPLWTDELRAQPESTRVVRALVAAARHAASEARLGRRDARHVE